MITGIWKFRFRSQIWHIPVGEEQAYLGTHYIIAGLESLGLGKGCILKNFEIEDEAFHFLAWLVLLLHSQ